jgi:hypothetical protein
MIKRVIEALIGTDEVPLLPESLAWLGRYATRTGARKSVILPPLPVFTVPIDPRPSSACLTLGLIS